MRYLGCLRLNGTQLHGCERLCYMTVRSSCRKQRYAFVLILCFCLGKIHEHPQSIQHWKGKRDWFMNSPERHEWNGIDGEPVELEWNIFFVHPMLELLHEISRKMAENRIRPEEFQDRIIFTSMYHDIDWTLK